MWSSPVKDEKHSGKFTENEAEIHMGIRISMKTSENTIPV